MSEIVKRCPACGADLGSHCVKNGVHLLCQDDRVGVALGRCDLYKCPACGQYTVSGFTILPKSDNVYSDVAYYQKELQLTLEKCQRLEADLRKAKSKRPKSDIEKELDFYKPKTDSLKKTVEEFEKLVMQKNNEIDMLVERCRILQADIGKKCCSYETCWLHGKPREDLVFDIAERVDKLHLRKALDWMSDIDKNRMVGLENVVKSIRFEILKSKEPAHLKELVE